MAKTQNKKPKKQKTKPKKYWLFPYFLFSIVKIERKLFTDKI